MYSSSVLSRLGAKTPLLCPHFRYRAGKSLYGNPRDGWHLPALCPQGLWCTTARCRTCQQCLCQMEHDGAFYTEAAHFRDAAACVPAFWERYDPIMTCFCDAPCVFKSVPVCPAGLPSRAAARKKQSSGACSCRPRLLISVFFKKTGQLFSLSSNFCLSRSPRLCPASCGPEWNSLGLRRSSSSLICLMDRPRRRSSALTWMTLA